MEEFDSRICAYSECGGPIPARVGGRGPHRKYCSDECRLSVYRGGPRPEKIGKCKECGLDFERELGLPGAPKMLCSSECLKAYRLRYQTDYVLKHIVNNYVSDDSFFNLIEQDNFIQFIRHTMAQRHPRLRRNKIVNTYVNDCLVCGRPVGYSTCCSPHCRRVYKHLKVDIVINPMLWELWEDLYSRLREVNNEIFLGKGTDYIKGRYLEIASEDEYQRIFSTVPTMDDLKIFLVRLREDRSNLMRDTYLSGLTHKNSKEDS